MSRLRVSIFGLILAICLASQLSATVFYVDGTKLDNTGNGQGWTTAKKTIGAAIGLASSGDEVWVKAIPSPYYHELVVMSNGVSIYGGFAGNELAQTQRNWNTNITIIDGTGLNDSVITAGSGITDPTVIDGFTIQNGVSSYGGGILCSSGSVTISNNHITSNTATFGGGIQCSSRFPTITAIIHNEMIQTRLPTVAEFAAMSTPFLILKTTPSKIIMLLMARASICIMVIAMTTQ